MPLDLSYIPHTIVLSLKYHFNLFRNRGMRKWGRSCISRKEREYFYRGIYWVEVTWNDRLWKRTSGLK